MKIYCLSFIIYAFFSFFYCNCSFNRAWLLHNCLENAKLPVMKTLQTFTEEQRSVLKEAISRAGSKAKLARLLGVSRAAVPHWKKLPNGRLYQLQVMQPEWFK